MNILDLKENSYTLKQTFVSHYNLAKCLFRSVFIMRKKTLNKDNRMLHKKEISFKMLLVLHMSFIIQKHRRTQAYKNNYTKKSIFFLFGLV